MMHSTAETIREYLSGGSGGEEDALTSHLDFIVEDSLARKINKEEAERLKLEAALANRKAAKALKPREASQAGSVTGSDHHPAKKLQKVADLTARNLRKHTKASEESAERRR